MNELKPEDVMKALECHSLADISTCDDCPYCDISEQGNCGCDMARDALALLREKDAEIERRDAKIDALQNEIRMFGVEIARLKKHQESVATVCNRANEHYNALYEQAKEILKAEARAEAITEFAERLKKFYGILKGKTVGGSVEYHIDQIAKEMKEKL